MFSWLNSGYHFGAENYNWLTILAVLLVTTYLSYLGPHSINNSNKSRQHTGVKFTNEWLARSHLAYLSFFITLLVVNPTGLQGEAHRRLIYLLVLGVFCFWLLGLTSCTRQGKKIKDDHYPCGQNCELNISTVFRILGLNLTFACIMLFIAIRISLSSFVIK